MKSKIVSFRMKEDIEREFEAILLLSGKNKTDVLLHCVKSWLAIQKKKLVESCVATESCHLPDA